MSELRCITHTSELGHWEMISRDPSPAVQQHVQRYLGYTEVTTFLRRREAANANAVLIIGFGPPLKISNGSSAPASSYRSFVGGPSSTLFVTESTGASSGIQIDLTPIGAYRLFGIPMDELSNQVFELEDILGVTGKRLIQQLQDSPNWARRFDIVDTWIARRSTAVAAPDAGITWAWNRLNRTNGQVKIQSLAAEIGCSNKQLIAQFRQQIGLPPKLIARLLRFQEVVRRLKCDQRTPWVELAVACGYYDQAHFIRDFQEFAGATPSEYVGRQLPDNGGVLG